jgi:hypothetical protein
MKRKNESIVCWVLGGKNMVVDVPTDPKDHLVTALPLLDASKMNTDYWDDALPTFFNLAC